MKCVKREKDSGRKMGGDDVRVVESVDGGKRVQIATHHDKMEVVISYCDMSIRVLCDADGIHVGNITIG